MEYCKHWDNIPHNKHLGNPNDYWGAPQKNSHKINLNSPQQVEIKLIKDECDK